MTLISGFLTLRQRPTCRNKQIRRENGLGRAYQPIALRRSRPQPAGGGRILAVHAGLSSSRQPALRPRGCSYRTLLLFTVIVICSGNASVRSRTTFMGPGAARRENKNRNALKNLGTRCFKSIFLIVLGIQKPAVERDREFAACQLFEWKV